MRTRIADPLGIELLNIKGAMAAQHPEVQANFAPCAPRGGRGPSPLLWSCSAVGAKAAARATPSFHPLFGGTHARAYRR